MDVDKKNGPSPDGIYAVPTRQSEVKGHVAEGELERNFSLLSALGLAFAM